MTLPIEVQRAIVESFKEGADTASLAEQYPVEHMDVVEHVLRTEIARLAAENEGLREYINLALGSVARLIIMCGYPSLEAIFPDPVERGRISELKLKVFERTEE